MKGFSKWVAISAAAILVFAMLIPGAAGLSEQGLRSIGLMLSFLLLVIFEVLPPAMVSLLFLALAPIMGVTKSFAATVTGFASPIPWFILSSFGIAMAFGQVPLSSRIWIALAKLSGRSIRLFLLAFMASAALISAALSAIPTTVLFLSMAEHILNVYQDEALRRASAKTFMIAIPIATFSGGLMTPIGSSISMLCFDLMEQTAGIRFPFLQWMTIGIPFSICILLLSWLILCRVHPPASLTPHTLQKFVQETQSRIPGRLSAQEIIVLAILLARILAGVLSTWLPIDLYVVTVIGCCVCLCPKFRLINWNDFIRKANWNVIIMTAAVISLGTALTDNGVSAWLVSMCFPTRISLPPWLLAGLLSLLIFGLLVLIPVSPSVATILAAPLSVIAVEGGYSPKLLFAVMTICIGQAYLLPFDSVPLLAYERGYFSPKDLFRVSFPTQLLAIFIISLWVPAAVSLTGG